jgi:hypothetical protein
MPLPLKAILILFVFFVLMHWMASGQDDIIEGPPDVLFEQDK